MAARISPQLVMLSCNYVEHMDKPKSSHSTKEDSVMTPINKWPAKLATIITLLMQITLCIQVNALINLFQIKNLIGIWKTNQTYHQLHHQMVKVNKILKNQENTTMVISFSATKCNKSIAKQLEEERERLLETLKRDSNSNNNMKAKRKLNCAEISKCMDNANSVTLAHMHMVLISSKRKHISQATLWPSFALNSMKKVLACMVKDANSCTVFMI